MTAPVILVLKPWYKYVSYCLYKVKIPFSLSLSVDANLTYRSLGELGLLKLFRGEGPASTCSWEDGEIVPIDPSPAAPPPLLPGEITPQLSKGGAIRLNLFGEASNAVEG